jgi:hypothetical protein
MARAVQIVSDVVTVTVATVVRNARAGSAATYREPSDPSERDIPAHCNPLWSWRERGRRRPEKPPATDLISRRSSNARKGLRGPFLAGTRRPKPDLNCHAEDIHPRLMALTTCVNGHRETADADSPPTSLLSTQKQSRGVEPQNLMPVVDLLLQITGFVSVGSPGPRGRHWHFEADLIRHLN